MPGYNGNYYGSTSGTITAITASVFSVIALRENSERTGAHYYNYTDTNCFVSFGLTSSLGSFIFTHKLAPSGSLIDDRSRPYSGIVTVSWDAASNGRLVITELSSPVFYN